MLPFRGVANRNRCIVLARTDSARRDACVHTVDRLTTNLDLSPVLRQMVKTHFSLNGELSHGIVS
jgi:hypothetical protein